MVSIQLRTTRAQLLWKTVTQNAFVVVAYQHWNWLMKMTSVNEDYRKWSGKAFPDLLKLQISVFQTTQEDNGKLEDKREEICFKDYQKKNFIVRG